MNEIRGGEHWDLAGTLICRLPARRFCFLCEKQAKTALLSQGVPSRGVMRYGG